MYDRLVEVLVLAILVRWYCEPRLHCELPAKFCENFLRSFHNFYLDVSVSPVLPSQCYVLIFWSPLYLNLQRLAFCLFCLTSDLRVISRRVVRLSTPNEVID